jgi:hypothetical protein
MNKEQAMTTIEQAETGATPETAPKSVTEALEYAHAFGQVAALPMVPAGSLSEFTQARKPVPW